MLLVLLLVLLPCLAGGPSRAVAKGDVERSLACLQARSCSYLGP